MNRVNTRKLKAAMALEGMTAAQMQKEVGIGKSAWFRKLNGTSQFTQTEICRIRSVLNLNDQQTMDIFFDEKVS